ncbi:MAG TPA: NTP transferase domain-containing protein, partial [Solirubrobacteraceae bacterium]|nr:NTP transferase domain-containing protein [Solirubrobacteraceae bacterium]
MARIAGIVLAGGRSTRMGAAKAALEWHGSTLLRRVAGLVARGVDGPVVVVRAPGQALPALPATIELADDA